MRHFKSSLVSDLSVSETLCSLPVVYWQVHKYASSYDSNILFVVSALLSKVVGQLQYLGFCFTGVELPDSLFPPEYPYLHREVFQPIFEAKQR